MTSINLFTYNIALAIMNNEDHNQLLFKSASNEMIGQHEKTQSHENTSNIGTKYIHMNV
jgi:hypothetical protein